MSDSAGPGRPPTPAGFHGRPTAGELLDATLGYLRDDLAPRVEGPDRHMLRIAVRALEVVARELELGAVQEADHARRLAGLGFADDASLARAIRAGDLPDSPGLRAALAADTADRLRVANPAWLPPAPPGPDARPGSPGSAGSKGSKGS